MEMFPNFISGAWAGTELQYSNTNLWLENLEGAMSLEIKIRRLKTQQLPRHCDVLFGVWGGS